jgi:PHD/YefM family antitoxin component YafN of YafNO toxin-antitoxin module
METIHADMTVSMSEFKKNPAVVLRQAAGRPVAVLNHNKAAFYVVEPQLFEAMLAELAGPQAGSGANLKPQDTGVAYRAVVARMGEIAAFRTAAQPSLRDN